jgi:hypothetical protein
MGAGCRKRFRCGDSTAVLLFLLVVVVVALAQWLPTADASISLNLKSSILSNILSPPKSDEEASDDYEQQSFHSQGTTSTTNTSPAAARKRPDDKESNFLRLDLSGRVHCYLLGPMPSVMGDGSNHDQNANALSTASSSSFTPLMTTRRPIFQTTAAAAAAAADADASSSSAGSSALSVVVGADYDFSQRWYGATRLLTSVGWSNPRRKQQSQSQSQSQSAKRSGNVNGATDETDIDIFTDTDTSSINNQYDEDTPGYDNMYHPSIPPAFVSSTVSAVAAADADAADMKKPGFWSRLVPAGVKIQAEHCLQDDREFVGQVAVDWEHPDFVDSQEGRPSVQARFDSTGKTEAFIQLPLHQRLQVQWKVSTSNDGDIMQVPHYQESEEGPTATKRGGSSSSSSGDENAWWMPDVSVDALGRMESKNEAWLPSPMFGPGGRVGLRLFVSRRLNWNAMGFANDGMESQTLLKLEVQAISGGSSRGVLQDTDTTNYPKGQSITTARLETELERPVSAARLFVLQEHALGVTAP